MFNGQHHEMSLRGMSRLESNFTMFRRTQDLPNGSNVERRGPWGLARSYVELGGPGYLISRTDILAQTALRIIELEPMPDPAGLQGSREP